MKLPIPLLLHLVSLGLFGVASSTVYEMLPLWRHSKRQVVTSRGLDQTVVSLQRGKSRGPALDWNYGYDDWWAALERVNLVGSSRLLPSRWGTRPKGLHPNCAPSVRSIELVSLVGDGATNGRGGKRM